MTGDEVVGRAFTVSGRVQGVGFRWHVRDAATARGVWGWVANRPDGTVRGEVFGPSAAVEAFLTDVRRGPPGAYVADVTVTEAAPTMPAAPFEIRR